MIIPSSGCVTADLSAHQSAEKSRRFLNPVNHNAPDDLAVRVFIDNSSTLETLAIHRSLLRHRCFTMRTTHTCSSSPNLVERWFVEFTERLLRRSSHPFDPMRVASIRT